MNSRRVDRARFQFLYIRRNPHYYMPSEKSRSSKDKKSRSSKDKKSRSSKDKSDTGRGEQPQVFYGEERTVHEQIIERRMGEEPPMRERKTHEEIIERRLGEEPPSVDAYSRALEQWKKMPGSVVRPPTDVRPPATKAQKSQDARSASQPISADASES
jgi:hypothetical protein